MKVPIPSDWNGENWECVQIHWPNSPEWFGILAGLLTLPTRGRYWEENTGSIVGVQNVGWDIFDRAYPFVNCNGKDIETGKLTPGENCGGITIIGGDDMGQVVTDVYIDKTTGQLVVEFGKCCKFNYTLLTGMANETVEEEGPSPWPDETEYSACGKATATINLMWAVGQAFWDEKDNFPWSWTSDVKSQFPQLSMGNFGIMSGVTNAIEADALGMQHSEVFSDSVKANLICALAGQMEDDYSTPDDMKNTLHTIIQSEYGFNVILVGFWGSAVEAIGNNDLRDTALSGATDTDAICSCSNTDINDPTEPTENGWYLSRWTEVVVYSVGDYNTYMCNTIVTSHDAYGCQVQAYWDDPPVAGYVPVSSVGAGCGSYDVLAWGDTSQQLQYLPQGTKFAGMVDAVANEVLGVGEWENIGCNYEGNVILTPNVLQGEVVSHAFDGRDLATGKYFTSRVRLLHNTGSPSHA